MPEETQELVVRVSPDGVEETTRGLDDVGDTFEDTAETAERSASGLEEFSEKFRGAMQVAVAALAAGAAGLLSQVPIIGELMNGLFAIVRALAFQIDQVLRPTLGPLSVAFANAASSIAMLDGVAADIVGVLGAIVGLATIVGAALSFIGVSITGTVLPALAGLATTILGPVIGAIGAFIAIIGGGAVAAIVALVAAVVLLAAAFITNWMNIREVTANAISLLLDLLQGFWVGVKTGFRTLWDFIVRAFRTGANLAIGVVESLSNSVIDAVNSAIAGIERLINSAARAASRVPGVSIGGVSFGRLDQQEFGRLETRSTQEILAENRREAQQEIAGIRGGGGGGQEQVVRGVQELIQAIRGKQVKTELNLDGRSVAEDIEQFIGKESADTGRTGRE